MTYWLVKSEPSTYSFADLLRDGKTRWDGVRNFAARNHLRGMKAGDKVLVYHSGDDKAVIGLAEVSKAFYPDPTAKEDDWSAVDLKAVRPLKSQVTLAQIKAEKKLVGLPLIKQSRLSVMPVEKTHFETILKMGDTNP